MGKQITPFSAIQTLLSREISPFNSRTIADIFGFEKFQTHSLLNRMEQAGYVERIERCKFMVSFVDSADNLSF